MRVFAAVCFISGCGAETDIVRLRKKVAVAPQESRDATVPVSLVWKSNCRPDAQSTSSSDSEMEIDGNGSVSASVRPQEGLSVQLQLENCDDEEVVNPREIIIAVDTSLAMGRLDPFDGQSCQRLRAIEEAFGDGENSKIFNHAAEDRISLLVFSDGVPFKVPGFSNNLESLLSRLSAAALDQSAAEIICGAKGGRKVSDLEKTIKWMHQNFARPGASRNVLLISTENDFEDRTLDVDALEQSGVSVAYLGVTSEGTELRAENAKSEKDKSKNNGRSSRMRDGSDWHVKKKIDQLSEGFNELFEESFTAKIEYRKIGRPMGEWTTIWPQSVTDTQNEDGDESSADLSLAATQALPLSDTGKIPAEPLRFVIPDVINSWGIEWRWSAQNRFGTSKASRRGQFTWTARH